MNTSDEKRAAFALMKRIGGSFAVALAEAWFKADLDNKKRIEIAFSDLLYTYMDAIKHPSEWIENS